MYACRQCGHAAVCMECCQLMRGQSTYLACSWPNSDVIWRS